MSDKATVQRKGTSKNGHAYDFSISVTGLSVNGNEIPFYMVQATLEVIADKIVTDIDAPEKPEKKD